MRRLAAGSARSDDGDRTFPLNRVIPCWTSALPTMKVGGKAMLVCAPEAAYGARGAGNIIPPNATLYFDVELLEIVRP